MKIPRRHYEYNLQIIEQDSTCNLHNGEYGVKKTGNSDWSYIINPPFEEDEGENYNHKFIIDDYSILLLFDDYIFESEAKNTKQINRLNDILRKGFLNERRKYFEDQFIKAEKLKTRDNFEIIMISKHNGVLHVDYRDHEMNIYPLDTMPLDAYKQITPLDDIRGSSNLKCGEWCKDGIYGLTCDFQMDLQRNKMKQNVLFRMKTSTDGHFELTMKFNYFRGRQIVENLNTDSLIAICYSYDVGNF